MAASENQHSATASIALRNFRWLSRRCTNCATSMSSTMKGDASSRPMISRDCSAPSTHTGDPIHVTAGQRGPFQLRSDQGCVGQIRIGEIGFTEVGVE